jgi:tRNA-binding protein
MQISYDDFRKVDIRVGRVVEAEDFPDAKHPSYRLKVDFGKDIGVKTSVAQITTHKKEELIGNTIIAVVNFPPKKIGGLDSEVLTLGVSDGRGSWVVIRPSKEVVLGTRVE